MSNYKRYTRECTLEQLRPELLDALRAYLLGHGLADVEAQIVMCCETMSEKQTTSVLASLFGEDVDQTYYTGAFFTPQILVWVRSGDKTGAAVVSAQLREIRVRPYASPLVKDAGLEVIGYVGDSRTQLRGYIGLGTELAARKFCEAVKQAVDKVNPPRNLLDVFGSTRR
jgi:hypothetical protein